MRIGRALGLGIVVVGLGWAQVPRPVPATGLEPPDAQRTRGELFGLLVRYPPALRNVLALDPSLLGNATYLEPYPALVSFLNAHPEVARDPSFYIGDPPSPPDNATRVYDVWRGVLSDFATIIGFGMGIGLLVWLIRTLVDYRRWIRLAKVQNDFHTKLLDRFTANNDLLAYIQSPAGSKFLESTPIALDAAPRSVGAPLSRILWSVQGGIVLIAGGIGLHIVGGRVADPASQAASQSLHALGIIGIALGVGFVISAVVSFAISQRLGLIEPVSSAPRAAMPGVR